MRKRGIASRVDDSSATIGKKYARNDELGTPFGCTVDFASMFTLLIHTSMTQSLILNT